MVKKQAHKRERERGERSTRTRKKPGKPREYGEKHGKRQIWI